MNILCGNQKYLVGSFLLVSSWATRSEGCALYTIPSTFDILNTLIILKIIFCPFQIAQKIAASKVQMFGTSSWNVFGAKSWEKIFSEE